MKNLYRVLACLAFLVFITITGSLILNNTINKTITFANLKFDKISKEYAKSLGDDKFFENLYFINCFPNVCAKVSHLRYEKSVINTPVAENKDVKTKKSVNKYRYDLGTTDFIVAKYSPLTNKITSDLNANNIILAKNNKTLASAYFKKLNYEKSSDLLNFYKSIFGLKTEVSLNESTKLNIDTPRVSYGAFRAKAESLDITAKNYNETKKTISSLVNFKLQGLSVNNETKKLDLVYDIKVDNFDKKAVLASINNSNVSALKAFLKDPKSKQETMLNSVKYLNGLIEGIKLSAENKTLITLNNFKIKETDSAKNSNLDSSITFNGQLSLDKNLDLVGNLNIVVESTNKEDAAIANNIKFLNPKSHVVQYVFAKQKDGVYTSHIKFENGLAIINGNKIDVKGRIGKYISFGQSMLNIFGMKLILAEQVMPAQ